MELVDKYVYAIGRKLPYGIRGEVELELKSLLLDEIESKYGNNPTNEDLKMLISEFGSPSQVASRYRKDSSIIDEKYSSIYFLLIKILFLAMSIAFSIVFFINMVSEFDNFNILSNVLTLFSNIISSSLSAIGAISLLFIIFTRFFNDKQFEFEKPWSIKELDDIVIKKEKQSKISVVLELFFTIFFLVLINYNPNLISLAEKSFELSTISLGHYVNIEVFKMVLVFVNVVWTLEIIGSFMKLFIENIKIIDLYEIVINILNIVLLIYIVQLKDLYINYINLLGFRGILVFVTGISIIGLIINVFNYIKYYIFKY